MDPTNATCSRLVANRWNLLGGFIITHVISFGPCYPVEWVMKVELGGLRLKPKSLACWWAWKIRGNGTILKTNGNLVLHNSNMTGRFAASNFAFKQPAWFRQISEAAKVFVAFTLRIETLMKLRPILYLLRLFSSALLYNIVSFCLTCQSTLQVRWQESLVCRNEFVEKFVYF